jgi:putrescine aminotransferase
LEALKGRHSAIVQDIRQLGLMIGIKTSNEIWGQMLSKACYDSGLLCVYANNDKSVLQFLPPLIITEDEAREALKRLEAAFQLADSNIYKAKILELYLKEKSGKLYREFKSLIGL